MKILVTDKIAEDAVELLQSKHDVTVEELDHASLIQQIAPYHALIIRSRTEVGKDVLEKADNLAVIGRAGIGVDNIDIDEASNRGIKVVNSPSGTTVSVAELTLGHMLSLARNLIRANETMKQGIWAKKELKGLELHGKTLGLVGAGRIGCAVAKLAQAFGMEIIYFDLIRNKELERECTVEYLPFEKVLENSDFISLHVPLTLETEHLFGEKQFKTMKKSGFLINCSRGGVVNETALLTALENKEIAGAALDVFEDKQPREELLKLNNIVLTPHLGASTAEGQIRAGTICAQQVLMALSGEEPTFWVNKNKTG